MCTLLSTDQEDLLGKGRNRRTFQNCNTCPMAMFQACFAASFLQNWVWAWMEQRRGIQNTCSKVFFKISRWRMDCRSDLFLNGQVLVRDVGHKLVELSLRTLLGPSFFLDILSGIGIRRGNRKGRRGRSASTSLLVGSDDLLAVLPGEETGVSLDGNEGSEHSRNDNGTGHEVEGIFGIQLTEAQPKADSSTVASSAHNASNGPSDRGVDIWNDTVGGSLCTLNDR
mmetsp:Transcript_9609/g.23471  ORF Transcript_9609/g.23471 Transcript_9609/m.23471 type:complete len:226 (+) Transcript_9609:254-931(+)